LRFAVELNVQVAKLAADTDRLREELRVAVQDRTSFVTRAQVAQQENGKYNRVICCIILFISSRRILINVNTDDNVYDRGSSLRQSINLERTIRGEG